MKYTINKTDINLDINQEIIGDDTVDYCHRDLVQASQNWYSKGYCVLKVPEDFIQSIRKNTLHYLNGVNKKLSLPELPKIERYHQFIRSNEHHLEYIREVGKHIKPDELGLDQTVLAKIVKKACGIEESRGINCKDLCDIRLFRPFLSSKMDNNPLHRDTWLPVLNNCVNIYIPVAGSNENSSLALIPGSHLWERNKVSRTKDNAKIKGIQYGLPSVAEIQTEYEVIRPHMANDEILIFSSNIIHGGSVNLNKEITRCSIEIRFWEN